MSNPLKTLIVDDESLARAHLKHVIASHPAFEVAGECQNGEDAVAAVKDSDIDVVFLDVQMPDVDGLTVIDHIPADERPVFVMVTAHDQYAVGAYEKAAVDYILKPFDQDRFSLTAQRVLERFAGRRPEAESSRPLLHRVMVHRGAERIFVSTDEISSIHAAGNYCRIRVGERTHVLRTTLAALEERLDPQHFQRIHRSAIVNLNHVGSIRPLGTGDYEMTMQDGRTLRISRTYWREVSDLG